MKQYEIHYEVDTGYDYWRDTALVFADDEYSAVRKLKNYISALAHDYMVSEVFYVIEFTKNVFSGKFRPKKENV